MNRNRQFCGGSLIDDNHILTVRLDVVVTQPDTQVLHIRLTQAVIKQNFKFSVNYILYIVYIFYAVFCENPTYITQNKIIVPKVFEFRETIKSCEKKTLRKG